jgi:hypothetical protein
MRLFPALVFLIFCLIFGRTSFAAVAQSETGARLSGIATVGAKTFPIVLKLSCGITGGEAKYLAVNLDVPEASQLRGDFDISRLGGGTRSEVMAIGKEVSQLAFWGRATVGSHDAQAKTVTFFRRFVTGSPLLQQMQAVTGILLGGSAHLVYTVENPRRGGPALEAVAEISDEDVASIKSATAVCLPGLFAATSRP